MLQAEKGGWQRVERTETQKCVDREHGDHLGGGRDSRQGWDAGGPP